MRPKAAPGRSAKRSARLLRRRQWLPLSVWPRFVMRTVLHLTFWIGTALSAAADDAAEFDARLGGVHVHVWMPPGQGRAPVLVFSHGFGGCAQQSAWLTEGLAAAGYLVVAPEHRDALCDAQPGGHLEVAAPFTAPERWTPKSYDDRRDDVWRVLTALREGSGWRARADLGRIGLIGHSLGGYTVLGVAGAWPDWRIAGLDGLKAVVALSPYCQPFLSHGDLGAIGVPVLYEGGTIDMIGTPHLTREGGCYDSTGSPAELVVFRGAGHLSWTGLMHRGRLRAAILDRTRAFLDAYILGQGAETAPTDRALIADSRRK